MALLALMRVEAGDVRAVHVDLGGALDRPLGDRACDPRSFLDPDRGHRPEVLHLGRLAEDRHPVRGQREQPVDRVADSGALDGQDLGHQLERLLQLQVEVLGGEGELGGGERGLLDRRDLVRVHEDRTVRVGADLHVAAVLPLVHVRVDVADDREEDLARRLLEERDRADADHLVDGGRERDRGAGHLRDPRAPDAAADEDVLRLDRALVGVHSPDAPVLDVDPGHLGARGDRQRAEGLAASRISVPARSESTQPTPGV